MRGAGIRAGRPVKLTLKYKGNDPATYTILPRQYNEMCSHVAIKDGFLHCTRPDEVTQYAFSVKRLQWYKVQPK